MSGRSRKPMTSGVGVKQGDNPKMIKCEKCNHLFEKYNTIRPFWSGDHLEVCPGCGISVWEGKFTIRKGE